MLEPHLQQCIQDYFFEKICSYAFFYFIAGWAFFFKGSRSNLVLTSFEVTFELGFDRIPLDTPLYILNLQMVWKFEKTC